ncbi:alcohol dehydrogenase [Streptomyces pristinaespiralis ATCC 25486]|uniref:2-deoxy-scyllo-inosamine dehydrogenase n=1 Tax=Streptomyces pristinaespiralis (strain ATCC 25486 / DSM 40338 / CBS 914.69 / JCM 4507 / KCC S-0507 / NBRC 13074 / NRRL 2958 / 5647) TaxID=457429 RepID=D6X6I3_STRE2|nr:alcohol dehydrogenase [Streptomyces pristinaespiralis ATCC 25486]
MRPRSASPPSASAAATGRCSRATARRGTSVTPSPRDTSGRGRSPPSGTACPARSSGRKVVGEGFRNCQVCDRCHAGDTTLCGAGYEETGFTQAGAMAATLTLPARLLHPLPDDADLTAAALLEPAACVAAAALKADVRPGERVAVVGTGTLGMLAVQLLAACSPAALLMVGTRPDRAALARAFGATEYRTVDELPLPDGFDVVVEAAGSASAARTSAGLLRRGGRLVLTGIPAAGAAGLDPTDLVVRQLEVQTVFGATPAAWAHAVRAFAAGLLTPLPLVTHELSLDDFEYAIGLVGSGDPAVGKVLRPADAGRIADWSCDGLCRCRAGAAHGALYSVEEIHVPVRNASLNTSPAR